MVADMGTGAGEAEGVAGAAAVATGEDGEEEGLVVGMWEVGLVVGMGGEPLGGMGVMGDRICGRGVGGCLEGGMGVMEAREGEGSMGRGGEGNKGKGGGQGRLWLGNFSSLHETISLGFW